MFYATKNQGKITANKDFHIAAIPVDHQYGPSQIEKAEVKVIFLQLVMDLALMMKQIQPMKIQTQLMEDPTRDRPNIDDGTNPTYEDPNPTHEDENTPSGLELDGSPMLDSNRPENEEVQVHTRTSHVRRSTRVTKQPAKFQNF
jgi:hypothetical protein